MATHTDASSDQLFELYSLLQDLMTHHVDIDNTLKELALRDCLPHDFEPIENASSTIIAACEKIEHCFAPKRCAGCCCQT